MFASSKTGVLYWADVNPNQLFLTTSSAETTRLTNFVEILQEVSEMKHVGGQRCVHFMYFIQRTVIYFLGVIRTLDPSMNLNIDYFLQK
jgi:hypothetical protein